MFGSVYVFLPKSEDKLYYSNSVRDILTDLSFGEVPTEKLETLHNSYKSTNHKSITKHAGEILVDSKKYFLIDYINLSKSFKSKFLLLKILLRN